MHTFRNRKFLTMSLANYFDPVYFYCKMKRLHDLKLARNNFSYFQPEKQFKEIIETPKMCFWYFTLWKESFHVYLKIQENKRKKLYIHTPSECKRWDISELRPNKEYLLKPNTKRCVLSWLKRVHQEFKFHPAWLLQTGKQSWLLQS